MIKNIEFLIENSLDPGEPPGCPGEPWGRDRLAALRAGGQTIQSNNHFENPKKNQKTIKNHQKTIQNHQIIYENLHLGGAREARAPQMCIFDVYLMVFDCFLMVLIVFFDFSGNFSK